MSPAKINHIQPTEAGYCHIFGTIICSGFNPLKDFNVPITKKYKQLCFYKPVSPDLDEYKVGSKRLVENQFKIIELEVVS